MITTLAADVKELVQVREWTGQPAEALGGVGLPVGRGGSQRLQQARHLRGQAGVVATPTQPLCEARTEPASPPLRRVLLTQRRNLSFSLNITRLKRNVCSKAPRV